jgi:hypothetical protein
MSVNGQRRPVEQEEEGGDLRADAVVWREIAAASALYDRYIELSGVNRLPPLDDEPEPSIPTMETPLGITFADQDRQLALLE